MNQANCPTFLKSHPIVLTGEDGNNMGSVFEDRCLWMRTRYEYKTICISDFGEEELRVSPNPFAAVLLVAREVLMRAKGDEETRDILLLEEKTRMAVLLKEKMAVFGEQKARAFLSFLNNYVVFKNPEINNIFMERTDKIFQKPNTMGILEQLAEIKHQEGVEEGMERGLEKAVRGLLDNTSFTPEKIAEVLEVPVALVERVRNELNTK